MSIGGRFLLALAPLVAMAQVPAYSVRTVAGRDGAGDGGLAINALIPAVSDVAIDNAGNVFISQLAGPIRRITPDGVIVTLGNPGSAQGLTVDNAGNLYLAANCALTRMNAQTGAMTTVAGSPGSCVAGADGPALSTTFLSTQAVAIDLQGGVLIAEPFSYRIRRLDLTANTVTTIAGTGRSGGAAGDGGPARQADIGQVSSLSLDSKGDIFFTDAGNCLVRRIDATGGNISTIAGVAGSCGSTGDTGNPKAAKLFNPRGILVSPAGNLVYVGEPGSGRIRLVNLDTNIITTIAGNGTAGLSGDGGPATQAMIGWAWGMVFDKSGDLLFSDYLDGRLRTIDASQNIHTFAGASNGSGDQGPAVAALISPSGVVSDGHGGLYIDDFGDRSIRQVVPPGIISTLAGGNFFAGDTGDGGQALNASLSQSYGLTIDSAGVIYFTESSGKTRMISSGLINKVGSANLNFPQGIAVDAARQFLYIAEYSGDRVAKVNIANGIAVTLAGLGNPGDNGSSGFNGDGVATTTKLQGPNCVALDGAGNVYVLDSGNNLVRKINPSTGQLTTVAGNRGAASGGDGGPATQASLGTPQGLTVDSSGNIFISEGNRIRRVDAVSGIINTIAGTGATGFSGDGGPALQAQFNAGPLSVDSQGDIFLLDQGNRVRELFPSTTAPQIDAAIVAAGFGGGVNIAPGTWMEIYGENLSPTTRTWQTSDFHGTQAPNSLDNVKVLINGKQGYIDVISLGQINAQVPDGVGTGNVSVQVVSPNGSSNTVVVSAADRAPALLAPPSLTANGKFYIEALFLDGTLVGAQGLIPGVASRPAKAKDTIVLYGIGFGAVTPVIPPGTIATQASSLPNVVVKIGGVTATIVYAGQAGNFVGLDELYVTVPDGVTGPDALLSINVDGVPMKQTLLLAVQ